jgi:hypothetical protein
MTKHTSTSNCMRVLSRKQVLASLDQSSLELCARTKYSAPMILFMPWMYRTYNMQCIWHWQNEQKGKNAKRLHEQRLPKSTNIYPNDAQKEEKEGGGGTAKTNTLLIFTKE